MAQYNPEAPHQAVVLVRWEISERNEMGKMIPSTTRSNHEVFTFLGRDYEETMEQLNQFLQRLKNDKKIPEGESAGS